MAKSNWLDQFNACYRRKCARFKLLYFIKYREIKGLNVP